MIGFVDAVKLFFNRYADFSGRSSRAEYWWVQLFLIIASIILIIPAWGLFAALGSGSEPSGAALLGLIPIGIFFLAIIIPNIALFIRRLHDINQTGWIYLGLVIASFIPIISIIASIAQIVIACIPGTQGENKYGADPYGHGMDVFN